MKAIAATAPGKLFVVGEYAVLDGGRALVAAVDAGVRCVATPSRSGWWIEAPDLGLDASLRAAASDRHGALLAEAAMAGARRFGIVRPLRLRIEATHPASRAKHGLGGSAASVVSIVAALAGIGGEEPAAESTRQTIFRLARSVVLAHQQGRGSGADVAASVWGGWVEFRLDGEEPHVRRAPVASGLGLRAAWSGVACDTAAAIAAWSGNGRLGEPLERFWRALDENDDAALLAAVSDYGDALGTGDGPGAGRIASLVAAARAAGTAAKGSGAVGGDCVVALSFDRAALDAAEARWRTLGATVFDLGVAADGVRREAPVG